MRAFEDGQDCDVLCLPGQDINLLELFKSMRVTIDQRVLETTVQLSGVLDVKFVARDAAKVSSFCVHRKADGRELKTKRQKSRGPREERSRIIKKDGEISWLKMEIKIRREAKRRKKFTPKRNDPVMPEL